MIHRAMTTLKIARPFGDDGRIALIGNSPPRRCGIATFTDDLRAALQAERPNAVVDVRDIAATAALAILDRGAIGSDPVIELVGPNVITGQGAAEIWSDVTGQPVTYGGDDLVSFEERSATTMPP